MEEKPLEQEERAFRAVYSVLRPLVGLCYPMKCAGREHIPEGPVIVCANHSNYIDPLLLCVAFGKRRPLYFMAKKELRGVPVVGKVLAAIGCQFVDRASAGDVEAIRGTMRNLKRGRKVALFPEGTRVSEDNAVAAKTGAVRIACRLGVPILPVYVPRRKKVFSRVHIVIGEPYTLSGRTHEEYDALAADLMARIARLRGGEAV